MRLDPALLLVALVACGGSDERDVSAKARVVPKTGQVWGRDLARGLGLDAWDLCAELGEVDCIAEAHLITLGGVEPEVLGIDEPLANATASAPIAVDRVALAACGERWARDQEGPAVVFGPVIDKDSAGRRKDVGQALVQRLLSREATKDELEALESLHADLSGKDVTRSWAVGACVVVATSTEALFY